MKRMLPWLVVVLGVSGCVTSFQQVETSYVPHNDARPMKVFPRQTAEACSHRLFFFIPVGGDNSVNKALGQLTHYHAAVDNLLGVQVEQRSGFWLLGNTVCTRVSGYPVAYADNGPHWRPFEYGMMEGRAEPSSVAGTVPAAVPAHSPAYAPPAPGPSPLTQPVDSYAPVVPELPSRSVEPAYVPPPPPPPPPPPEDPKPTQADCDRTCGRVSGYYAGSAVVQATVKRQCQEKCMTPEKKAYRMCLDKTSTWDQVKACNKL